MSYMKKRKSPIFSHLLTMYYWIKTLTIKQQEAEFHDECDQRKRQGLKKKEFFQLGNMKRLDVAN